MAGQTIPVQVGGNATQDVFLPWPPGAIGITNPGSSWVHFPQAPGAEGWIPPRQYGAVIISPVASGVLRIDLTATPSAVYPKDTSDLTAAQITIYQDSLLPSPGQSLLQLIPSTGFGLQAVAAEGAILPISQTVLDQAAAASIVLNAPASIQNGDVLVAVVGETGAVAITSPTGWTRIVSVLGGATTGSFIVDVHTASLGDATSWTWTGTNLTDGIIEAYRGGEGVVSVEASASQIGTIASQTPPTAPSISTLTPGDWVLAIFGHIVGAGNSRSFTTPPGLTQRANATNSSVRTLTLFDTNSAVAPGTQGPYVSSYPAQDTWLAATVALIPTRAPVNLAEINGRLFDGVTKGVQPASIALPTQDFKDSGRVNIAWTVEFSPTGVAEALLTVTESRDGAATTTFTSKAVTSGKRLRLTSWSCTSENTLGANPKRNKLRMRFNTAGAATTASPEQAVLPSSATGTVNTMGNIAVEDFPDGMEWLGDGTKQIGFTNESPDWVSAAQTSKIYVTIFAFEY